MLKGVTIEQFEPMAKSYLSAFYKKYLSPGDVVYDIGAFRGVLTTLFAKDGYKVEAFEGSPRNFPYLIENTEEYKLVRCHPYAVHEINLTTTTRFNDCLGAEHPEQEITYVILDEFIEDQVYNRPDLIKIDIEGMESIALKGAMHIILNDRPIFQLSLHENHGYRYENFPSWVPKERGGFDFSTFKALDYLLFDTNLNPVEELTGFNEFLVIPEEKIL